MTSLFKDEIKSGERVHNPTLVIKGVFKYPVASTFVRGMRQSYLGHASNIRFDVYIKARYILQATLPFAHLSPKA